MLGWEGKGCSFGENAGKARGDGGIVRLCECVGLGRREDAQEVIGPYWPGGKRTGAAEGKRPACRTRKGWRRANGHVRRV